MLLPIINIFEHMKHNTNVHLSHRKPVMPRYKWRYSVFFLLKAFDFMHLDIPVRVWINGLSWQSSPQTQNLFKAIFSLTLDHSFSSFYFYETVYANISKFNVYVYICCEIKTLSQKVIHKILHHYCILCCCSFRWQKSMLVILWVMRIIFTFVL